MSNKPTKEKENRFQYGLVVRPGEQQIIEELKRAQGLTWPELVHKCILKETEWKLVSSKNLLNALDSAGGNLARSSQDIHELANWIALQNREGHLASQAVEKFSQRMHEYIRSQRSLEAAIRRIVRMSVKSGK